MLGRKQVIAILLKLKAQGKLFSAFKGKKAAKAGLHTLPDKPHIESLQRAILASAPVKSIKELPFIEGIGGSSKPYKVILEGGQTAVFKTFDQGGQREYLAYGISKALGFPNIPPTSLRRMKLSGEKMALGSAQVWLKGTKKNKEAIRGALFDSARIYQQSKGRIYPEILKQDNELQVFDYLTGNVDRIPGNILWDYKKNRLIAIDHADAFSYKGENPIDPWRSLYMDEVLARMPDAHKQEVGRKLKAFLRRKEHLIGGLDRAQAGMEKRKLTLDPVFARAEHLLDRLGKPPRKIVSKRKKGIQH